MGLLKKYRLHLNRVLLSQGLVNLQFVTLVLFYSLLSQMLFASPIIKCSSLFNEIVRNDNKVNGLPDNIISIDEFIDHTIRGITQVPEFLFIREQAQKLGLRVWLFGGTASSFLHYVKWDLARSKGLMDLQSDRFDYDYTNIFRSTQDLDIVVDGTDDQAKTFEDLIAVKFPHFLGANAKWEVRSLRHRIGKEGESGFKEALLNDADFTDQNTDSNSLGMVEITKYKTESVIRDLKHWNDPVSIFLKDTLNGQISFFRSSKHDSTYRAKSGENPEILSVIRILVKAFQYELNFSQNDLEELKDIINHFDPSKIDNANALRRIHETAKKLILHAVNIEFAMNKLDELGLRKKLITMGDPNIKDTDAWWLNREPLRSFPIGSGNGLTAAALNIHMVSHETNNFFAYESITRAHSGEPNVFKSRAGAIGEAASYGNGFYTKLGNKGARGTGLTVRFIVNPKAREGIDFKMVDDFIIFNNKKVLTVVQESLNLGIADLLKVAESNQDYEVDHSDLALVEKLKRKINAGVINDELNKLLYSKDEKDHDRLIQIISAFQNSSISKFLSKEVWSLVIKNVYRQISGLADSTLDVELLRYIHTVGPIIKTLEELDILQSNEFFEHLKKLVQNDKFSFKVRQQAFFELVLSNENTFQALSLHKLISNSDFTKLVSEIRDWQNSNNPRKVNFKVNLERVWSEAIAMGKIEEIEMILKSGFFDINHKNLSDISILQSIGYYHNLTLLDWLITQKDFDFNAKNRLGFTEVEQLILFGRTEMADIIKQRLSGIQVRKIKIKESDPTGNPIIDFVKIESGTFLMGDKKEKILTTISKLYEIMSIPTTQLIFRSVLELLEMNFQGIYSVLNETLYSADVDYSPKVDISFDEITLWIQGLNKLSSLEDKVIQNKLMTLFPGHKLGDKYRLPTDAEWEFAARLGGVADQDYSHGVSIYNLWDYVVFPSTHSKFLNSKLSNSATRKPVFYNGKPIYGILGDIPVWTSNWYSSKLIGGLDPQGPPMGTNRSMRGGGWNNQTLSSIGARHFWWTGVRNANTSFRLVRNVN